MNQDALDQFLAEMEKMWCFPEVAIDVMSYIDSPETNVAEVAHMLAKDQALAGKVLQIANSPFYGFSGKIGTLKEACIILGQNTLRSIVLAAGLAGSIAESKQGRQDKASLWSHALRVAAIAKLLSQKTTLDSDTAFTIGLLHDIGEAVITLVAPDIRDDLDACMEGSGCSLLEAEETVLGFHHGQLGEKIARTWHLPSKVIEAIASHHHPKKGELYSYAGLIYVADRISRDVVLSDGKQKLDALSMQVLAAISFKDDQLVNLYQESMLFMEEALKSFGGMEAKG